MELFLKHRIASASPLWHSQVLRHWKYSHLLLIALEVHFHILHGSPLHKALHQNGQSLREYMQLPKRFKILLDSGAFELALPDFAPLLDLFSNRDLIEVAALIKPDFVVPLDRIITEEDNQKVRAAKIAQTLQHTKEVLEASQLQGQQIIGPLHGTPEEMLQIVDQYRQWGITYFGVGGPVFRSLDWIKQTLTSILGTLKPPQERLHVFGLKTIEVGGDKQELFYLRWLMKISRQFGVVLSTDTSRNIGRTRRGFYLTKEGRFVHLRDLTFLDCEEPCCKELDVEKLRQLLQENDVKAKMRLFIHNSACWYKIATKLAKERL
ncbi:MAG: hypothetical protein ACFFDP_01085 [Promethearchaeota archaeon]